MKTKITRILLLFCLLLSKASFAQNKLSIENVRKIQFVNSGEILEGEELKGYFTFYVSDKIDRKTNEYTVQIVDNNLNKVKDIVFQDDKNVFILESSYNGNSIMFLFYNRKEKTLEYRSYGFDGKMKSSYVKELTKRSMALIDETYQLNISDEEGQNQALFSVGDKGFVTVFPVKEGKYFSYEVNFFFTSQKKQWTYEAAEDQEMKVAQAEYLGATDSLVIFEVFKRTSRMSRKLNTFLVGIDIFTGKKVFETSTDQEDYKFYPMNVSTIRGKSNFLVLGTYYEPDGKVLRDASLGLAAWTVDSKGKVIAKKYNSWETQIGKYLPTDAKGRVDDVGYVYFHNILQTKDGNFFAIGEGYKKAASALGIISTILSGGRGGISTIKLKMTDMLIFKFNDQFEIKDAKIYDKNSSSMELASGAEMYSPHSMALLAKAFGAFDYRFTQTDNEHTKFSIGYSDYEKTKEYKGETFHAINYVDGKVTTDRIEISSKAKFLRVFKAKPGFVMIMEYFKKDKRLDLRLEKLN
jgi:hypothetical protein